MQPARIIDTTRLPLFTTAAEKAARRAFSTPLHRTATSHTKHGDLDWGTDVTLLSRGVRRARVRTADGTTGYVFNELVVTLRWVGTTMTSRGPVYTTPLWRSATATAAKEKIHDLLWGDEVQLVPGAAVNGRVAVRTRGWWGWMDAGALTTQRLLEVYFIDVGQGDGVLIRTPDGRHVLIDGGYPRTKQTLGRNAADFVDWKFFKDYGRTRIALDAMIASHCDNDHYGGLWDLISDSPAATRELDCDGCDVAAFHHAGVSWWREPGTRGLGTKQNGFLTRLLDDRASVVAGLRSDAAPQLQGEWKQFLERVVATAPAIQRLGVMEGDAAPVHVPGFGPQSGAAALRVLAPVFRTVPGGGLGVRSLGSDSQNTNGHSVLLRLEYGRAVILLTGDLNRKAQQALLQEYAGREPLFECDVAKGCHHGSDDVSLRFLEAVHAAATVISSGDSEGHGHPRPQVVAASAVTGFRQVDRQTDELLTPLVYSTEIERSVAHGLIMRMDTAKYPHDNAVIDLRVYGRAPADLPVPFRTDATAKKDSRTTVHYLVTQAGALSAQARDRSLRGSYVVSGVVYGLVNVRTDGTTILCATRNETKNDWNLRTFPARF